ncbi:MAG: hypothetical protein KatS3mg059_0116 [Thermomicrobiales bacterium]|nr:MAG: hypothetical protein KatS3mg059_0116 [Thermomicrobiales bacterium]
MCRAARAAERRPAFLASVFAAYRRAEHLDEQGLARILGIPAEQVCGLALCLRPRPEVFGEDVHQIAGRFHVDPHVLAGIIRHVEALEAMQPAITGTGQIAAAARDAAEPPDEDETP